MRPSPNARTDPVADASSRNLAGALLELQKLAQKRPALAESCQVLSAILPAMFGEPATEAPLRLSLETAATRLRDGVPLLRGQAIAVDEPALHRRWRAICAALRQTDADGLADAVQQGQLRPAAILDEVLTTGPETLVRAIQTLGLNSALAATVLRMSVLPALAQLTRSFAEVRRGMAWEAGYCPHCGSWPLLGEARGLEQERFLRCGLCAASWQWGRLHCPFCANRDHRTLGYLHVEGEEDRYRAGTCDACKGYVKWASTILALSEPQLLVADLATLHLDLAAAERGSFVP